MAYFKHQYISMPTYTKADEITAAAQDLMNVLTQDVISIIGHNGREKLIELANIFNKVAKKLPMHKAEEESATITNNQVKPRVEIIHQRQQTTTQQPYQTHAKQNVTTTKAALTINQPHRTPKIHMP